MKNPLYFVRQTWQMVSSVCSIASFEEGDTPVRLQTLENRVLYDASPIADVLTDITESIEAIDELNQEILGPDADSPLITESSDWSDAINDFHSENGTEILSGQRDRQLVIIDEGVDDFETLLDELTNSSSATIDVVRLDQLVDGISQISSALDGSQSYEAIHVVAHGADAELQLGSTVLNDSNLADFESEISKWSTGLSVGGDILIYGCEVAESEAGQAFVDQISQWTGADIAVSSDLTGHSSMGGDWELEYEVGEVESEIAFSDDLLAVWYSTLDITSNLLLHNTFDSDASDASGNNYHGTLDNGAAINTNGATNQIGPGKLSLDGTNDQVNVSAHVADFENLTEGTIAAWVYVDSAPENQAVFTASDSGDADSMIFFGLYYDEVSFYVSNNGTVFVDAVTTSANLSTGAWNHIALTVTPTEHGIYVNGVQQALTYFRGSSSTNQFFDDVKKQDSMRWGVEHYDKAFDSYLDGFIDDGRVYDRALSSSDITELYNYTGSNSAPAFSGLDGNPTYTEGGAAVVFDSNVAIADAELDALSSGLGDYDGASVTLVRNGGADGEDTFGFSEGNGITLVGGNTLVKSGQVIATFDVTTTSGELVVTFTNANGEIPTSADVDNILSQFTYENTSDTPPAGVDIDWTFDDGNTGAQGNGGALQALSSTTVNITATNDAPVESTIELTTITYDENDPATQITNSIAISDVDDTNIESAVVQITSNYQNGEDVLGFVDIGPITGSWNAASGTLTLSGSDTLANYEAAFRTITYQNTSDDPSVLTRTVSFTVNDGDDDSNTLTRDINVAPNNDAPFEASIESSNVIYNENEPAVQITNAIAISDLDDTNIESATVQISGNYQNGEDVLAFVDLGPITGSWNATSGTLTLSGSDTLANYEAALRTVTYVNSSELPSTLTRTVSLTVNDGNDNSNTLTRNIDVVSLNDDPSNGGAGLPGLVVVLEDIASDLDLSSINLDDVDANGGLLTVTVATSTGGSVLSSSSGGVTVSGSGGTSLTLTGTITDLNAFLDVVGNVQYRTAADVNGVGVDLVMVSVNDNGNSGFGGSGNVLLGSINVDATAINDAPAITYIDGDIVSVTDDGTQVLLDVYFPAGIDDSSDGATIFDSGWLQVIGTGFDVADSIGIDTSGTIALSAGLTNGSVVSVSGINIGTLSGVSASTMRVDFNVDATQARVDTLLQSVTFESTSMVYGTRSVDFTFNDGDGIANGGSDTSNIATVHLSVADASAGLVTTLEDTTYQFVATDFDFTGITGTDLRTITVQSLPVNGTLTLSSVPVTVGQVITKAQIDAGLLEFEPLPDGNGPIYASFDFYVNNGRDSISVLAGEPTLVTLNGGLLAQTDAILADASNFGPEGVYQSTIVVGPSSSVIDTAYLATGSVLFNGFVLDANWTAGELADLTTWINGGGVLISNSDSASFDAVSSHFGLVVGGSGSTTWHIADDAHEIMNGPFGLVGNNGDPFMAAGTISYFDSASLAVGDQVLAVDSVSGEPTIILRSVGSGWILFTSDEGIFRAGMTGGGTIATANDILSANVFAWAADQTPLNSISTMNIDVTPVNDAPVEAGIEGTNVTYNESDPATQITNAITISDVDDTNIESAVVQITGSYQFGEDILAFVDLGPITGSWNAATGTLTLSGSDTLANYETALRTITYENTSGDPSGLTRTVSFTVNDGDVNSNTLTRDIDVLPSNDAPVASGVESSNVSYDENDPATQITNAFAISDVDDTNIESAVAQITGNYQLGEDLLSFIDLGPITGSWNAATGTLTLSGSDTLANYESALRTITYQNSSDDPSGLTRTVSFTVNDGDDNSNTLTRDIDVLASNDAPVEAGIEGTNVVYSESDPATQITNSISITDHDDTDIESAIVQITGNFQFGEDVLAFVDLGPITGSWNATTGTLTLSGSDTLANYETALRTITYENLSLDPSGLTRTISFTVNDGDANSNTLTRDIDVLPSNDAPVQSGIESTAISYNENDPATQITNAISISDVEDTNVESAVVQITGNYQFGEDVLAFVDLGPIMGSWSAATGTLTLSGSDTLANYEAALRTITYQNTSEDSAGVTRTISFTVNDGDADSNTLTRDVDVVPMNDAPSGNDGTVTTLEDTDYTFSSSDFGFSDVAESDGFDSVQISTLPGVGTLYLDIDGDGQVDGGEAVTAGTFVSVSDIDAGRLKFKPLPNVFGLAYDSFTFQVLDDGGTPNGGEDTDQSPNTLTINVTEAFRIEGRVLEEVDGNSNLSDAVAANGVTVHLYQDTDNDLTVSAGDVLIDSVVTDATGGYSFVGLLDDTYFVVVDSRTITPSVGFNGGFGVGDAWAEQTYGVAGALAADGSGGTTILGSSGAAFGGRLGDVSDDASSLLTSEHITQVNISGADAANIDSGFSFNVVTGVRDGDDGIGSNQSVQGSLRQFVDNSNAIVGGNTMRFVPTVAVNESSGLGSWWSVTLGSNLSVLGDSGTFINGVAYDLSNGVSIVNTNGGSVNSVRLVGVDEFTLSTVSRQEFEVNFNGNSEGFVLDTGGITITNTALFGAVRVGASSGAQIHVSENVYAIDGPVGVAGNVIGARADGTDPGALRGSLGMLVNGASVISNNYFAYLNQGGVRFNGLALGNSDGSTFQYNEVHDVASTHNAGDGITVDSTGIVIHANYIHDIGLAAGVHPYNGKGIELSYNANNNVIDNNTIIAAVTAGIGVGGDAYDNTISKNVITGTTGSGGDGGAGILITNSAGNPTGNTLTENSVFGNAGLGIDIDASGGATTAFGDGVTPNDGVITSGAVNELMDHPVITISNLAGSTLSLAGYIGTAPNQTAFGGARVEFYRSSVDSSGFGEGQTYLGFLIADVNGNFSGTLTGLTLTDADEITATATSINGSTSEFGPNHGVNVGPTDISPDVISIDENTNTLGGFSLGILTTTDADSVDPFETFTYSILPVGDFGNFSIGGAGLNELILDDGVLDFESKSIYNVTVRVTDSGGLFVDQAIVVNVNDLNEAPTVTLDSVVSNIAENTDTSSAIKIADIVVNDDALGVNNLTLSGADAGLFEIVGTELRLRSGTTIDFETQTSFDVNVDVDDSTIVGTPDDSASHTVNVLDVNEAPTDLDPDLIAIPENVNTLGGVPVATLLPTDVDAGETFTYSIVGGADSANFSIGGSGLDELILDDGVLDFETKPSYDVIVRVTDSGGLSFDQAIRVDVVDINEAPMQVVNTGSNVNEGDVVMIDNDALDFVDPEQGPGLVIFQVTIAPATGTLELSGSALGVGDTFTQADIDAGLLTYKHDGSESFVDGFRFDVTDGTNLVSGQSFSITINPVNDVPVAVDDAFTTDEDTTLSPGAVILGNDVDADLHVLSASLVSGPSNASTFALLSDGSFTYVPNSNFNGIDSFTYQVDDGNGGVDTAVVTITVNSVNDLPVASDDNYVVNAGDTLTTTASVLANDTDIDGDALVAVFLTNPVNGVLTLNADGNFVYTPDGGFVGVDSFTYLANDGAGNSIATTVSINVLAAAVDPIESIIITPVDPPNPAPDPDLDPEPEEEDDEEINLETVEAHIVGRPVPVVDLGNRPEFEEVEFEDDLFRILSDQRQAQTVLKAILSSVSAEALAEASGASELDEIRRSSRLGAVFNANFLWEELDDQIDNAMIGEFRVTVGALMSIGSLGYILWTLRGGALVALALSQLPSWRMIDPLPVLESYADAKEGAEDEFGSFFNS